MAIENRVAYSKPNAVGISAIGGGRSFLGLYPHWRRSGFSIQFRLRLGDDLRVAARGYIVLAPVGTVSGTRQAGAIDLILGARQNLSVAYKQAGRGGRIWGRASLVHDRWYQVSLQESTRQSGLALSVGQQIFRDQRNQTKVAPETAHFIGIGEEFSSPGAMTGHFYVDNLSATE